MKWECHENPKHNEPYPDFEEYYECSKCVAADYRLARLGVELARWCLNGGIVPTPYCHIIPNSGEQSARFQEGERIARKILLVEEEK